MKRSIGQRTAGETFEQSPRRPRLVIGLKLARKLASAGDSSLRRQTSTVCTGGNPGGNGRKISPGRLTWAKVAVVGATPKPADISHSFV